MHAHVSLGGRQSDLQPPSVSKLLVYARSHQVLGFSVCKGRDGERLVPERLYAILPAQEEKSMGILDTGVRVLESLAGVVERHPVPAAAVTIASVVAAAWTNYKNRKATIFGHSMQAVTHLDQRWESAEMKAHRRQAGAFLYDYLSTPDRSRPRSPSDDEALSAVLNFLEAVGAFVKAGAIGARLSWQLFGSAAQHFVEGAGDQLREYRDPHSTVYSELQYLYHVARVEEDRHDWPAAWIWRRSAATALTWSSRQQHPTNWSLWWWLPYSVVLGRVHVSRRLSPLFPESDLLDTLARYGRPPAAERVPVSRRRVFARNNHSTPAEVR